MLKEFKAFIMRGNVLDLAVAVVIGAAFTAIVNSVVNDLIMPVIGQLTAGIDFGQLKYVFTPEVRDAAGNVVTPESAIRYGNFINMVINFLIVAFFVFLIVKAMNKLKPKKEETPAPAAKSDEVLLLEEIRDALRK